MITPPIYTIGTDQPGGSQRYCLNGIYPGYIVGTGSTVAGVGDVTKAMSSLGNLVGNNYEVIKWSGALSNLTCGAPFSNTGYDGTLDKLSGVAQHVVLGLPLVEGPFGLSNCVPNGTATVACANVQAIHASAGLTGPGVPSRCYIDTVNPGVSFTVKSYATGAAANVTAASSVSLTGTWFLRHTTAGKFDAKIAAIAASIVARGFTKLTMTVLPGWEMDGSWAWGMKTYDPLTDTTQSAAQYIAAFQHFVTVMRAVAGFNCRFEWNTNWQDGNVYNNHVMPAGYPGDAYCDVLGWDAYNSIANAYSSTNTSGIQRTDFDSLWLRELKPSLDNFVAMAASRDSARAALGLPPLMVGHSECGVIVYPDSRSGDDAYKYHTADTDKYWSYMHAYWQANAARFCYIIFFNQNQSSGSVTTEDNQMYYSGSLSGQTLTYYHNTSTDGPWVVTPSTYHTLSLPDYQSHMVAGSMQLPDAAVPAVVVPSSRKIGNFFYPFG